MTNSRIGKSNISPNRRKDLRYYPFDILKYWLFEEAFVSFHYKPHLFTKNP